MISDWRPATKVLLASPAGHEIKCPRCDTYTHTLNSIQTCAGCGAPWRLLNRKYQFKVGDQEQANKATHQEEGE